MYHYSLSYATFGNLEHLKYRKIPKISPGAYIFQRPFLRGLFLEGLIFEGAYLWGEICVLKFETGVFVVGRKFTIFALFNLYLRANSKYNPPGGFFVLRFWGAYIWKGLYMGGLIFRILR